MRVDHPPPVPVVSHRRLRVLRGGGGGVTLNRPEFTVRTRRNESEWGPRPCAGVDAHYLNNLV